MVAAKRGHPMPLVIHPRVRRIAGRLAAMTCLAMFATTGAAMASCPSQPVSQPFAQFGDTNSYFLAPGGSFEGSPAQVGWALSPGAQLTPGNETYYVNSPTDSQSLTINAGASATSPAFCLDSTMPSFRFFVQEPSLGEDLQVQLITRGGTTSPGNSPVTQTLATVSDGSVLSWSPWNPVSITAAIPAGSSVNANLKFSVAPGQGAWQIDDVYIDPYRVG
jgi:hypothetical protein